MTEIIYRDIDNELIKEKGGYNSEEVSIHPGQENLRSMINHKRN